MIRSVNAFLVHLVEERAIDANPMNCKRCANEERPHDSLGSIPPSLFRQQQTNQNQQPSTKPQTSENSTFEMSH
jgi:hypothetical protein